jgi:POT family proton-dependent oligopeptide transporter
MNSNLRIKALLLIFGELLIRFSYWGIQGILVLYAIQQVHLPKSEAFILYGSFTAATFAMSIVGGYIADKFLGRFITVTIGAALVVIGNILITTNILTVGLAIVSSGIGIFLPNNVNLFGEYIKRAAPQIEQKAFGYYYSAINAGALCGPVTYGYIYKHTNINIAFYLAAGLVFAWWLLVFVNRGRLLIENNKKKLKQYIPGILSTMACVILIIFLLHHNTVIQYILVTLGMVLCYYYARIYFKNSSLRLHLVQIAAGMFASLVFFSFAFQVGTSLLILGTNYVNNSVFGHVFPSSAFVSLEPLFVVIFSPIITSIFGKGLFKSWQLTARSCLGLIVCSMAFSLAALLCLHANGSTIPLGLFICIFAIMGLAETIIVPPLFAKISSDLPPHLKSTIMGMMYLFFSFSSYTAGLIATRTSNLASSTSGYVSTYSEIAVASIIAASLLFIIFMATKKRASYDTQTAS